MDGKINKLKQGIFETHLDELRFKLNEVISMGESPIEKLMLLQLFNYFQKYGKVGNDIDESDFSEIKFIEEEICLWDIDEPLSNSEKKRLEDKIERFNYRYKNGMYYKYIGFKCTINRSEGVSIDSTDNSIIFRDIEVRPQFYEAVEQNIYRIDIAFILNRRDWFNNDKIIDTKKIAIECDGYDYHSSPDQKRDDDIRARKLKRGGWKEILRYSGSEINRINDNLELTHYNFEEIMDIILL
jgi:hypothetical protein